MFFELLTAILLGLFSGIFTGLIPGIHVNLISLLVLSASPLFLQLTTPIILSSYIISLAITHSFVDSLPSIYLGAPDEAQALNVLPGHKLLHRGEGHNAILCTLIGSYGSLIICLLFFPLIIKAMELIYPILKDIIGIILLTIATLMIFREKTIQRKVLSAYFFITAGVLGISIFSIPNLKQALFPLLSGLFGFSIIITSLLQKAVIPEQDQDIPLKLKNKSSLRSISAASSMGFIAAFLPGFGNSQAAIIANEIIGETSEEAFLTLVGGINTANMLISIATMYSIEKARNGAIVVISELMNSFSQSTVLIFLLTAITTGGLAVICSISLSKVFLKVMGKVDYRKLLLSICLFIALLTFIFDGLLGLLILTTATTLGLAAALLGVSKNHLMGCLVLPVILYFLF